MASEPDVRDFFQGTPVVIKPTNRHASVGVLRVDRATDIPRRWRDCAGANEVRTVAEEFAGGYQVSVETLSRDGEVIFTTVDLMLTAEGLLAALDPQLPGQATSTATVQWFHPPARGGRLPGPVN